MKKLLVGILVGSVVLGSLAGCFSFGRGHGPVDAFQFLTSRNPGLDQNVTGVIHEQADPAEILVVVPPAAGSLNLVATFSLNTQAVISVVSSGRPVVQQNGVSRNDFSAPVLYSLQVPGDRNPWRYRVTVRYAETNAALSQISIPEGYAMSPLFSPRVKSYTVEVPWSVTRVRIDAKGQSDSLRDITIDGASSGGRSASTTVDFSSGYSRAVSIETLAEDGITRDAYTVVLKRLPADANAKLESLEVVDAALSPSFSPARTAYRAEVPFDTAQVVVKAKAQSRSATITLQTLAVAGRITSGRTALASRGSLTDRAGAIIDFSNGTLLPVIVAVTAEDGSVQEYLVEIARAEPDHNNALAELTVDGGTMTPAFTPRTLRYAVGVPYSTRRLAIAARTQSAYARMELLALPGSIGAAAPALQSSGDLAGRGGVTVEFPTAERIVLVVAVTAQDGKTAQYILDVRRAPPDSNADLGALTVSTGVLSPIFSPRIISYAVSLPTSIESVRMTASTASVMATVTVEGTTGRPAASQTFTVSVAAGATETINLMVSAEDGTQKMYRVRVSREATGGYGDRNARLARLQLVGAQVSPNFDPRVLEYEARMPSNVNSITLTATAESTAATIEVDGQPLGRTGRVITLEPGASKTVIIDVIAEASNAVQTIIWLSRDRVGPGRDTNARLARLQFLGAQLAPNFDPRVLEYSAQVASNANSVTLTATAESTAATIEVDGQLLGRTGRIITLGPGAAKTVIVDVTAEAGNTARTIIWLSRESARDTNTRLARLQLVGAQLSPNFDPRMLEYSAQVAANVNSVTLTATAESTAATITVDGQLLGRNGRVITLDPRETKTVLIDVTAEAGNVARTIIWLSRESARDTNARLARLQLAGAQLSPNFDARVFEYQARLEANVNAVTLMASTESPVASIAVDGQPLARTGRVIALDPGTSKTVLIDVTAEAGNVARTIVRLSREAARDTNARLSRLQLAGAQLTPNFDARVIEYQARLEANVNAVTLMASTESPLASIAVDGQPLARTGRVIALDPGTSRTVIVDVTAEAGNVARTIVRLSRVAARDTNANLARLQLAGAQLAPNFDARVFEYQARLEANVNAVTLMASTESPLASIAVDGQPLARTGRVIALDPGTSRTVLIDVTAEAGNVARTIVRLSRVAARDTNANLARLQLAGAQLTPNFDARVFEYQARLEANVNAVTLMASTESPLASIAVDGQPMGRTGRVIEVEPGSSRTVLIDVTAEAGNVTRTIVRLSREAARDTNARLSRLQLAGAALRPNFDPRVLEYQAQLASNVASVVLTATAESPAATIEIDGQPMGRTGRVIEVEPGSSRTVLIDVTAEAGNVARTVVRLSREAGGPGGPGGPGTPGSDRISVTLNGVKITRQALGPSAGIQGSIGEEARITARYYRTNTVIAQGTAKVDVRMQGGTMALTASWSSPGVKLDTGKLVEVEVAIQADGATWLHYTEAQWPSPGVAVDVPFLLSSRDPRVAWPAVGRPVSVAGYIPFSVEGPGRSESAAGSEDLELNAKGEYAVEVTLSDPASGRVLGTATVSARPGFGRSSMLAFSRPMSLPEGATVKYSLTAKARNGKGWAASGTTQVWTTTPAPTGGFEPVILRFGERLAPQR